MKITNEAESALFYLSRIGASVEFDGYHLCSDYLSCDDLSGDQISCEQAKPVGAGIRLRTRSEGEEIWLWVPETEWCAYLAPQLAAPSLAQIAPELLPLLASWTLAPLDGWLQQSGQTALAPASAEAAPAPAAGWRLLLTQGARCLPIYLEQVPERWQLSLLQTLLPSPQQSHTLPLILGWSLLSEQEWATLAIGDALPIVGACDSLERLWLYPGTHPTRLKLIGTTRAVVEEPALPLLEAPPGTLRLSVEAGQATLAACELANWAPGNEIALQASATPLLQLSAEGRLMAQGELLRMDNGWAVRIRSREM